MIVYNDRNSLSKALLPFRQHKKIGLIPTMGALHHGHLTIIKQALEDNDPYFAAKKFLEAELLFPQSKTTLGDSSSDCTFRAAAG